MERREGVAFGYSPRRIRAAGSRIG